MHFPISKLMSIKWQCPNDECEGIIEIPLKQRLKIYSTQGNWHCPICQNGSERSTTMKRLNELIESLNDAKETKENISLVFDME